MDVEAVTRKQEGLIGAAHYDFRFFHDRLPERKWSATGEAHKTMKSMKKSKSMKKGKSMKASKSMKSMKGKAARTSKKERRNFSRRG